MRPRSLLSAGLLGALLAASTLVIPGAATAAKPSAGQRAPGRADFKLVDRAVVRFSAGEAEGRQRPYFIYERELAFEARLAALSDPTYRPGGEPYRRHHLQGALERHIAEVLLANQRLEEPPSAQAMARQAEAARGVLEQQVGGAAALAAAAQAEGIGAGELELLFRRQARASFYLDTMVTPMLEPSELELRRAHRSGKTPFSDMPFDEARPLVQRWYVGHALRTAAANFYQSARSRLKVEFL